MISTSSSLAVVGLLDQNYRFKSVPTQIPHDAGLARSTLYSSLWYLKIFNRLVNIFINSSGFINVTKIGN